ncbi:NAD(P)-binding domain-containing protein [Chondromyces crocatus]|uniref:FAD-dependent oxidoreductase n=1 Tax=Chondromyces crocatus TaxID=52 RepID=A0A0K1EPN8_CHOCO|nr:NAD(P)/FAD-dependent oxidoreductase [Chondromyces crocatus]AKT42890.1 FAD-dependent oxidoreductase [Chondromyces crocatus]
MTADPPGLPALEAALRRDLALLDYPRRTWVPARRTREGADVLDVLIIGGGQSGSAVAFGLLREKVTNLLVIDENERGREGPWLTFARMITLRTPKHLVGIEHGLPNLTLRSWYEAQFGQAAWESVNLVPKEQWAAYLDWYRRVTEIPFRSETRALDIRHVPEDGWFAVQVVTRGREETLYARKVVLATGIDGSGRWETPQVVAAGLPKARYAHTHDPIDFAALRGRRIAVLGAGASAFDNASVALEQGAREVHLFYRRETLPCVNPYRWAEFAGFLRHHADLPDLERYRFIAQIFKMGQLPPTDTYERATRHPGFHLHGGSPWKAVALENDEVVITTPKGRFAADFVIVGTGFVTDLSLRPELRRLEPHIARWQDRFTPPAGEVNEDILRHPYLGPGFELQERTPGEAPYVGAVFNYTFGCLPSLGFGGASISGLKYSLPRVVGGVTRQLYCEDSEQHLRALAAYDTREF